MIVFVAINRDNLVTDHLVSRFSVSLQTGDERIFEVTERAVVSLESVSLQMLQEGLEVVELDWTVRTGVGHEGVVVRTLQQVIFVLRGCG